MTFISLDNGRNLVPELCVEVDVTNAPTNPTRVWTDITRQIRAAQWARSGRSDERQRTEVATLTAVVANTRGSITSLGIAKAQWIRVRYRYGGVIYPRWQGIFESLPRRWPAAGKDDLYELRAAGPLKIFRFCDLNGQTFPSQRNDQRFSAIASLAGVATGSVDTNTDTADAVTTPFGDGSDSLSTIQEIEASENGLLLEDPAGTVSFQGRHWRLLNSITPKATIGDIPGQIPYRDTVSYEDDDQLIANIVEVTPNGGSPITVSDSASQTKYWPRKLTRTLLTSDTTIGQSAAEYLLNRYKDPDPRIPQVEIPLAKVPPSLMPVLLAANNSDRFTFFRNAATPISEDVFIENIAEKVVPGGVGATVTLQLSPADREFGWILGDATYGQLGVTTRLSY